MTGASSDSGEAEGVGLGVLQTALFLLVAFVFGARYPGGPLAVLAVLVLAPLTAAGIGGIASAIALRIALTRLSGSDAVRRVIVIASTPPPAESTIGRYRNCSAAASSCAGTRASW